MLCANIEECFGEVGAYFDGEKTGHFLIVNAENYDAFQQITQRLQADTEIACVYISENCNPNGFPDVETAISKAVAKKKSALIGLSQALLLRERSALEQKVDELLEQSINGYGVVVLEHCEQILRTFLYRDIRLKNRVILVEGESSPLPQIRIAQKEDTCIGFRPLSGIGALLEYLEKMTNQQCLRYPAITVVCPRSADAFRDAVYSVTAVAGIYQMLSEKYSDICSATEEAYGQEAQWAWLAKQMEKYGSFSELVCKFFGATTNLSSHLPEVIEESDSDKKWLLWLAMKVFPEKNHLYLQRVLRECGKADKFEENCYLLLAKVPVSDANFERYYHERKTLLTKLPENLMLIKKYCEKIDIHQKEAVYYLTDGSNEERFAFVKYLSLYDYTQNEIMHAVKRMSKDLSLYLEDFVFDELNTKLSDADAPFRAELTEYFKTYKWDKLVNRISPEMLEKVNQYAYSRPYNKLLPRTSILSHMKKTGTQLFFFDALGVEYLAFILAKCERYGLVAEVSIGHSELPSITSKNKEFLQSFEADNVCKIDALDEIKHHSQIYNYQKCPYPLHLFEELEVIDEELRRIQTMLVQGSIEKALLASDHGASRLAVIYGHDVEATIALDESGEHSGRCCPAAQDPHIPYAAYEDGFAALGNYDRFKGGRRANVEVHGGATLEETLVPIIVLSKKPENLELCFVNPIIALRPRVIPTLTLYSNMPMQSPQLFVDGTFYSGEFVVDKKHVRFELPKIKRKGVYHVDIYDSGKKLPASLEFRAEKQTREIDIL